jgi:hypothetical protein
LCISRRVECELADEHLELPVPDIANGLFHLAPLPKPATSLSFYTANAADSSPITGGLPRPSLCNELVEDFFNLIHDKQLILFHERSFNELQRQGKVPGFLILGIVALVAR